MIHIKFFIFVGMTARASRRTGYDSLDFCQLTLGNQQYIIKENMMLVEMTTSTNTHF